MAMFDEAHQRFLEHHLSLRKGERRGRLERGHGHGEKLFLEKVWWPLKGSFDRLHPEYELLDWRNRPFFGDFVYFTRGGAGKIIIEVKGYASHVKELDRQGHANECKRELFLEGLGFRVVSIAYDDIRDQPLLLVALMRMLLSQYESDQEAVPKLSYAENELIRLSLTLARPIRPIDVQDRLRMSYRRTVRMLNKLSDQGWFRPEKGEGGRRVVRYALIRHPHA